MILSKPPVAPNGSLHGLLHKFQNFHTETNPPSKFFHLLLSHKTPLQKASGQRRERGLNSDSVPHNNLASWQGSFNPGGQRAYSPYNAAKLAHSSSTCTSTPLHLCFIHYKASHLPVLIFLWILSSFLNWNSCLNTENLLYRYHLFISSPTSQPSGGQVWSTY